MKNQILNRANVWLAVFALLNSLLVTVSSAALPTISVNFTGCCNDGATPAPTSLLATDVAGVVPLPNWNNLTGNNVNNAILNDSNGAATTVTIFYNADEQWGSNAGTNTPDRKMLNGYLGISNGGNERPLLLNNVPNGAYKLIMYNGRGDQQPQAYTVNDDTANRLHIMTEGAFTDVFIRGTSTNPAARDVCNYVQFDTVAPVGGTIKIDCRSESFRGMMNGIQLIPLDPGAFRFIAEPQDATRNEEGSVSFYGNAIDGTGTVTYQWLTNGVPDLVNGLTQTYTRSNLAANENGRTFQLVATDSTFQVVTSRVAVLTVNKVSQMVSATSAGQTNRVFVRFSKEVALTGTYTLDNGATVLSAAYGSTHRDVILTTSLLVEGTTYTLTATGETREDDGSPMVPEPNSITFFHGFGRLCSDFTSLPAGTALFNNGVGGAGYLGDDGTGTNMVVHLTDDAGGDGAYGKLFISNRTGGDLLKVLDARWRMRIGGDLRGYADGVCFNWATDLAANGNFVASEEGEGTGVSFIIDTWDNGSGPDTGIEIKWRANRIAFMYIPRIGVGDANFICKNVFVDSSASVTPAGLATFTYNGNTISATIPGWNGIANGNYAFSARTGGELDNFWIDDVCINNYTLGPVFLTQEPVDTTVPESTTATFTAVVDGSPPYYIQWFTNGVPVPGANGTSYTTPPTTAAYEGMQVSVVASNDFSTVTSSNATLRVLLNPRLVTVFSRRDNEVHFIYTRAVDLGEGIAPYDFDNGAFELERRYGTNNQEVIIVTDAPLTPNTTYTVTITDVNGEGDPSNIISPNPTTATFRHGYGSICADFEAGLPPGGVVLGNAVVSGGVLHVTDAVNSQQGNFFLPDQNGGQPMDRLVVKFKTLIGSPNPGTRIADGMSFNVASDISAASSYGEEGAGSGLTITFDTWDNNAPDTAPAIEVRYKGTTVAVQAMSGIREGGRAPNGPFLFDANGNPLSLDTSNQFVNVLLMVSPDGKLDLYFKNTLIFQNVQLPNYTPFVGANYGFGARTGGANENAWIDDLCINNFSLGDPTITRQPANVTVNENPPGRGSFSVDVDGLPPYTAQWYSNGVAVAGATALAYTTPPLNRTADGAQYFVIVSNVYNSVTSTVATVTVIPDTNAPILLSAASDCSSNVYVRFSETVGAASANNPANYTISNGVIVTGAFLTGDRRTVILTVSPPINPNDYAILTVNGVEDISPFPNAVSNARILISARAPVQASGANNLIVVEAEDYDINRSPGVPGTAENTTGNSWTFGNFFPGYVASGYMDVSPNNGGFSGNGAAGITNSPRMDYCINFPVAGTYYAWFRGATHINNGAQNSLHFGLNGGFTDEFSLRVGNRVNNWGGDGANFDAFGWVRDVNGTGAGSFARINIPTAGVHTLNVWMREAGLSFDRFLLTTDAGLTLTTSEFGPPASVRPPTRNLSIVTNGDGTATISWAGTGWTLQSSPTVAPAVWTDVGTTSPATVGPSPAIQFFRLIGK